MSLYQSDRVYDRELIEQKMISALRSSLDKLEFFWKEFGITGEKTADRANLVVSHITAILGECEKEEEELYENIKKKNAAYIEEIRELAKELDIIPEEPDEIAPLIQKEKILRMQLDDLEQVKHTRLKEYKVLLKKESRLCDMLRMPKTAPITSVPKRQDLQELEQHIHMLSDERERRYQKFCSAKRELTTIMEVTEYSPETSFEREVICFDDEDAFILSQENLDQISQVVKKYQKRREEMIHEQKLLMEKLKALWDRLDIDREERELFLSKYRDLRQSALSAMKEEIERCEEIKKQNICQYVYKLREELSDLWDKCCIDSNSRERFSAFSSNDFTEDLLEIHEMEVEKLKDYYANAKDILEKIQKRKKLWDLMLIFEKKASDPSRFTNRGGNLLQEEKERKKLLKDLPKLEEAILQAIEQYEEENNQLFLVNGINFADFIRNQWDEHMKEKENEKLERQRQRTIQQEASYITPGKRPIFGAPASAPSKLFRTNTGASVLRTTVRSSKPGTPTANTPGQFRKKCPNTNIVQRVSSRLKQLRITTPVRNPLHEANKKQVDDHNATSYSQFAMELDKNDRNYCRSSVLASKKKKVLGSKISHSGTLRKSSSRSSRKSSSLHSSTSKTPSKCSNRSLRNTSRTPTKVTPARGKFGRPFLI